MPSEKMHPIYQLTEDEFLQIINEEQIDFEEDGIDSNTNNSDTWSNNAAAGRNRGRNVARRGRISPHSRTAFPWNNGTPFQRGVTFNGFAKNLELEEILDCTVDPQNTLLFHVKWRNDGDKIRQIECNLLRTYSPQLLMDFYEKKMIEYRR